MKALSPLLMGLLVLTPVMVALGQVMFKLTGARLASQPALPFYTIATSPLFIGALMIYGLATLVWIYVLKSVPLSYAYTFMAMTFIIVPALAGLWLNEPIPPRFYIGASLIVAGLVTVWSSAGQTS